MTLFKITYEREYDSGHMLKMEYVAAPSIEKLVKKFEGDKIIYVERVSSVLVLA